MTDLDRAQAVVEGCPHSAGSQGRLACVPCISAYAEQVRREERERCAKMCDDFSRPEYSGETKARLYQLGTALRTKAGETR